MAGYFRNAVLLAANLADDADSGAAVTGQLAGALYGFRGIPGRWLDRLAFMDRLIDAPERLLPETRSRREAPDEGRHRRTRWFSCRSSVPGLHAGPDLVEEGSPSGRITRGPGCLPVNGCIGAGEGFGVKPVSSARTVVDRIESRCHVRGSLALERNAVAVEEAGGAGRVAAAPAALGRDAEVGDGPRRGRDAAPVAGPWNGARWKMR